MSAAERRLVEESLYYIRQLPSGIDDEADEDDLSPLDMSAHLGGMAARRLEQALGIEATVTHVPA